MSRGIHRLPAGAGRRHERRRGSILPACVQYPFRSQKGAAMRITCLGAARCVTGSCFLLDNGNKYLIDCGLFQGGKQMDALNHRDWAFDPGEISAVFLTHSHIDHSGRLPKLVRDGFMGKIYATQPTAELCRILLLDSAHIQEMEAEWRSRKNRRQGEYDVQPLYTVADATACSPLFEVVSPNEQIRINHDLTVCFRNAGHILGSSILEIWSGPPGETHKVVFSGDIGSRDQLIVEDPDVITDADTLFMESTYGNRNHKSFEESTKELREAILYSHRHKEKVIVPAFAVERTQELLYIIGGFLRKKMIPSMPVYVDSPLAIAATKIFRRMSEFYDSETHEIINSGHHPFDFPELILSRSAQESMAINQTRGTAIVIAGNGMCTAGRIQHHLKHNLWRPGASLVIVGFQAMGTPGRKIIEGAKSIKVFGERVVVRARLFTIGGLSAHADQSELIEWLSHFRNPRMQVNVIHGEEAVSEAFAALVKERYGFDTYVPAIGDVINREEIRPAAAVEALPEFEWQNILAGVARRADEIRRILAQSTGVLPQDVLQQFQRELTETENHLDEILLDLTTEMGRRAKPQQR